MKISLIYLLEENARIKRCLFYSELENLQNALVQLERALEKAAIKRRFPSLNLKNLLLSSLLDDSNSLTRRQHEDITRFLKSRPSQSLLTISRSNDFRVVLRERNDSTHPRFISLPRLNRQMADIEQLCPNQGEFENLSRAKALFEALKSVPDFENLVNFFNSTL